LTQSVRSNVYGYRWSLCSFVSQRRGWNNSIFWCKILQKTVAIALSQKRNEGTAADNNYEL